jgi:hypothetical protein
MGVLQKLSALAVQSLVSAACKVLDSGAGGSIGEKVSEWLQDRFTDHSTSVIEALRQAHERAWQALEFALAGDSLLDVIARADDVAFREQVRSFLKSVRIDCEQDGGASFRGRCLEELRAARKAGLLGAGTLDMGLLAREAGRFAGFTAPSVVLDAEWQILGHVAEDIPPNRYPHLARLLGLRPAKGSSVLVVAVRYFFRQAVATDDKLFRELTSSQIETIRKELKKGQEEQEEGLASLGKLLGDHKQALATDPSTRAEAFHNAYQSALERRKWSEALNHLNETCKLDADAEHCSHLQRHGPGIPLPANLGGFLEVGPQVLRDVRSLAAAPRKPVLPGLSQLHRAAPQERQKLLGDGQQVATLAAKVEATPPDPRWDASAARAPSFKSVAKDVVRQLEALREDNPSGAACLLLCWLRTIHNATEAEIAQHAHRCQMAQDLAQRLSVIPPNAYWAAVDQQSANFQEVVAPVLERLEALGKEQNSTSGRLTQAWLKALRPCREEDLQQFTVRCQQAQSLAQSVANSVARPEWAAPLRGILTFSPSPRSCSTAWRLHERLRQRRVRSPGVGSG